MARAHEVAVGANARDFERAIKQDVIKPTEDAARALDDLGDAGDDASREATRSMGKLEDALKDVQRQSDNTGTAIGRDIDKGFDKAKQGADDFKSEASSSIRETAASITSVEDALGAVQEIAANAFSGFGPVGAGAGLVAALGFGLLLENLKQQGEAADEMKRRWADAYAAAAEAGRAFLDQEQIANEARDIRFNPDRVNEYNQAVKDAAALNLDVNDVLLARAGDEKSLQTVIDTTKQKYEEIFSDFARARSQEAAEIVQIEDRYKNLADIQKQNARKAREDQDAKNQLHEQERKQIARTKAADQSRYEALAEQYAELAKPVTKTVRFVPDESALFAAQRRAEAWARAGLRVAVTGTLAGRTFE